jgi:hypothetical protein
MSFRRTVFEACGGFDEGFGRLGLTPTGCDETEFSLRARRMIEGSDIVYEPRARVGHFIPASRANWSYFVRRCWGEGYSKALVVATAGRDGTKAERAYVLRTLPAGAAAALLSLLRRRDTSGPARAAMIVAGLAVTTAAYVRTSVAQRLRARTPPGRRAAR